MRILLLIDNLGSGGAQRKMVTLARMLKEHGESVQFLVYGKAGFFRSQVDALGIHVEMCNARNNITRIIKVRRYIRRGGFDAVISFMDTPNFLNCISAVGGHKWKVITTECSCKEQIFHNYRNKIFNWFQRWSDSLVCNSERARQMWLRYHPEYTSKLKVIYNPVILPIFTSEYKPLRDGKLHIVVAASFQELKNPIGLAKAVALLLPDDRAKLKIDWYGKQCVTVGGTQTYDTACQIVTENGLEDVLVFHNSTMQIIEKMNEADCIGLFSRVEGLPNAVCEGMSLGKPIIMSRVSDFDVLTEGGNGYLCDWDNIETIRDALLEMINLTEEELLWKGDISRRKAKRLFSPELIISMWLNGLK